MIPVDQTIFGKDKGNCYSASLASILELKIDDVPFMGGSVCWIRRTNVWLRKMNLTLLEVPWGKFQWSHMDDTYVLLTGKSPRGDFLHTMVGMVKVRRYTIEMLYAHDPHPSRDNILDLQTVGFILPTKRKKLL